MTRWFRFYGDAINNPKVLRLSDAMFRAWVTLLCLASQYEGVLPKAADIALILRMKVHKVAEWLAILTGAGLLDSLEDGTFRPHNWDARQFKSDVADPTAVDRNKRYRDRKRNDRNATVTLTDTRTETEQIQKKDAASAAPDPEGELFRRGREVLGKQAGGLISKLLTAKQKNVALARAAIEQASTKSDPREYIGGIIRGKQDGFQWNGIEGVL
jgi:hypothetical protein